MMERLCTSIYVQQNIYERMHEVNHKQTGFVLQAKQKQSQ